MRRGTLLFLVLLVLGLGYLALQKEREAARGGPAVAEFLLRPELALERVKSVRIEHLERGVVLELERDAQGRWFLTDPLEYPAQGALIRQGALIGQGLDNLGLTYTRGNALSASRA